MSDSSSPPRAADAAPKPVVLCILDGWGDRDEVTDNAIALAETPTWDRLVAQGPFAHLMTSSTDVGLPIGQMGNSEVGHTNLGAGRVVLQDLPRIDTSIQGGRLAEMGPLVRMIARLRKSGGTCHLLGLLSPGGVHSHQNHMVRLAEIMAEAGVPVAVHGFTDGRDAPPKSAKKFIESFEAAIAPLDNVRIATLVGRYYALDRDKRWDRVEHAYRVMVGAKGRHAATAQDAMDNAYAEGLTDEFLPATVIGDFDGMQDGDGLLMANFRADRAREILTALVEPGEFHGFHRVRTVDFVARVGMVEYSTYLNNHMEALFPPPELHNILGQVVAEAGLAQLRIAETEKYAHVTFFFNGGREEVFPGEDRILVPSPKVATYDEVPEMSAPEVTERLVNAIRSDAFDLIVVNYANGDMIGHTGNLDAAIEAVQTIDASLLELERAILDVGGVMLVTADHGNCEMMRDSETGDPHTQHTTGTVPLVMVGAPDWVRGLKNGRLADVAPTLLRLLALKQPDDMTGQCLITEDGAATAAAE